MITKFISSDIGDRQIYVVASDATPDRVGDVMVPEGCQLDSFRKNPIVLFDHDHAKPVGRADVSVANYRVMALITFAADGVSAIADEVCRLAKAGILNAVSVGFGPIKREPIKGGGWRHIEWDLMELSIVTVPANPSALVMQRGMGTGRMLGPAPALQFKGKSQTEPQGASPDIPVGMLNPYQYAYLLRRVQERYPRRSDLWNNPKWMSRQWACEKLRVCP